MDEHHERRKNRAPLHTWKQYIADSLSLSLSLRFNGHFPGEPGLYGVYWSKGWRKWWWQLERTGRSKLQSNHHHQQTNTQFFTGRMPFLSHNQHCQSTEGKIKISHSMDLLTPSSPGVFQLCLWPLVAPGYFGGGLPCLSSALWCQYPDYVANCQYQKNWNTGTFFSNTWTLSNTISTDSVMKLGEN